MLEIPLEATPSQAFTVTIGGAVFAFRLVTLDNGALAVTIARDGATLIEGVRALPNRALIPYRHLEGADGNFAFLCPENDYPAWEDFGMKTRLLFADALELEAMRNA